MRLVFILPFWAVGYAVTGVATALWASVLSPLMGSVLGWVVMIAAMVGAFGLAAKAIFPNMPWRKIFNRRSVLAIIILGALLGAADLILPTFWTGYIQIRSIVRLVGTLGIRGARSGGGRGDPQTPHARGHPRHGRQRQLAEGQIIRSILRYLDKAIYMM